MSVKRRDNKNRVFRNGESQKKDGRAMVAMHLKKYFQHIIAKYNKIYKEELPKITPHVCRHIPNVKNTENHLNL